jgi:hypothetical protein
MMKRKTRARKARPPETASVIKQINRLSASGMDIHPPGPGAFFRTGRIMPVLKWFRSLLQEAVQEQQ